MGVTALPTQKKPIEKDFDKYLLLLYGREKIGKTTTLADFPSNLFLATEPGTKGLSIYEVQIKNWKDIRDTIALLRKDPKRGGFKRVTFDTADRAYDYCLDYVCSELGIEYPGETDDGQKDYGKSWKAIKLEFMDAVHELINLGLSVAFTSHATEQTIKPKGGEAYTRIFPSMGKQARTVIEALVDFFFYCDYARDTNGNAKRIIITQGDENIWAGARETGLGHFPTIIEMTAKGGYERFRQGFAGQLRGLDPKTLLPTRDTAKSTAAFMRRKALKKDAIIAPQVMAATKRIPILKKKVS